MILTVEDVLRSVNAYPVPQRTLEEIASRRRIALADLITDATVSDKAVSLAKADILAWLANAPQVSQGGVSYSFSEEQRSQFRIQSQTIYRVWDAQEARKPIYGYKGGKL